MVKKSEKASCVGPACEKMSGCKVDALMGVDERGQMVLPKDLRDRAKIQPGDKLAVISWEKDGEVCCLTLIKSDYLADRVKDFLGPVMKTVFV